MGKIRRRSKKPDMRIPVERGSSSENQPSKIYLKAMPLRKLSDLSTIKSQVRAGNILVVKVSPLANRSIAAIKKAVNELCKFVKTVDGDIARLGEERIVITPSGVQIWREKPVPPQEQAPTAA